MCQTISPSHLCEKEVAFDCCFKLREEKDSIEILSLPSGVTKVLVCFNSIFVQAYGGLLTSPVFQRHAY